LLKLQLFHIEERFDEAELLLMELINHLKEQPSLKQFTRIAEAYTNLASTQMFNYKFDEAVKSNEEAMRFPGLRPSDKNYYKESLAILNSYLGNYSKSNQALKEIIAEDLIGNSEEELSRRKYLLATTLFLQGDYKKSNIQLQDTKEIENEKEGWNIGIRLLQIFLTLATEKIDLADQRIESLRKHIERTSKMKSIRKRDVVIFRILRSLAMNGFDFKDTWIDRKKDFLLLQSDKPEYKWIPRSHEVIIFHQWFESKVRLKKYQPDFTKK
jgi:tetratricopeptide (TPR) repeat protein